MWLYPFIFFIILPLQFADSTQLSLSHSAHNHLCPYEQSLALLKFKQSLTIERDASRDCARIFGPKPKMMYWNRSTDCCTWDGVTCDKSTGHVIGLDLRCSQLRGVIHTNSSLFQLSHLKNLDLGDNNFSLSPIPNVFANLANLKTLSLQNSIFTGPFPSSIGNLTQLVELDLSYNNFSLPSNPNIFANLANLRNLLLRNSLFTGPFPSSIGNLTQLVELDLSYNNFSLSSIPNVFANLANLRTLSLQNSHFTGPFPSSIGNLTQLVELDLSYNNFSLSSIPNVFANLANLRTLSLQNSLFTGPFPSSIGNMTQLVELDLSFNSLTGPLPSNIVGLHKLSYLDLSYNSLNGTIPSWLFAFLSLEYLDIESNQFTGPIGEFRNNSLGIISMRKNKLHGSIPQSISKSVNLYTLDLSWNNLTGVVELDMFAKLGELWYLDLSYNSLSVSTTKSSINANFPSLKMLHLSSCNIKEFPDILRDVEYLQVLDLSYNQIHGQLPSWVGSMGKDSLFHLNLSHNFLIGLDQLHWESLIGLDLRSNLIQGPLPSSICNLRALSILDLCNNSISGAIPDCFGNLSTHLSVLDLGMNRIHGTIPATFAKGNSLRSLNLHDNQLEGRVPQSLANCRNLEVLDLGKNKLNDTFPLWLGTLPKLQVLVLRSNRFHGPISSTSTTKLPFGKLRILDLSHNEFTGLLPSNYFRNFKAMMNVKKNKKAQKYMQAEGAVEGQEYYDYITMGMKGVEMELHKIQVDFIAIDLSSNKFEGEIPNFIGNLNSLHNLNLSHNTLTGHIPSVLGNLSELESLDLSSNQLVGEIPEQLTSLIFLAVLNLSYNRLGGGIPRGKQFYTFSNASYSGNSALCGFPLSKKCGDEETPHPPHPLVFQQKDTSNFASGFTWEVVLIGYGCGTVFGLIMGCLMFLMGKPKWFTEFVGKEQHKKKKRPAKRRRMRYGRRN